ncbi:MAG TPA: sugar ABC transporter substrate-binding protein [Gemmatimonadales bacterium]|nr:sugar ABC transporter substrate-binding protein [Gemmatimonadales bacterium]
MRRARTLAVALLAGGCGSTGAADGDHVTLQLANWATYPEARLEDRVLAPYLRAHPELRVIQQNSSIYGDQYRERILTSLAVGGGAAPDLFLLDNIDVPALVNRGRVLDLAPYVDRAGVDLGCFDQTVLSIFSRGDAVYALPRGYTPMVVAYNKDLFDRAGIPYPTDDWTWDDFLRIATLLTQDTDGDGAVDQWGTFFDRRVFLWIPWIWAGGGDVLCPGGRRATGCLDSPATIEAIRWYTSWVTQHHIVPRAGTLRKSLGDNPRLFATGRVGMMTAGHFWIPELRPYLAGGRLRVGFVAVPHRAGFPPATVIYASGYAVPATGARRRLAIELATYLTDSLAEARRGEAGLELPAVTAAARGLAARDTLGWDAAFLRAAAHGRAPWGARVERWREVEAALPDLMDRITLAGAEPRVAARAMAREIDHVLGSTR